MRADRKLLEHAIFHLHLEYVTLQTRHFRLQNWVADQQLSGTGAECPGRPLFQLFIQIGAGGYEIQKDQINYDW